MTLLRLALAAALLFGAPTAHAVAAESGCGTVIIPTGLGASAPAGVNSLNPWLTTGLYAHQVISQLYHPLVWIDRHGQADPSRSLAESVVTPDDGATFLVTLHDWKWSDGVPITADDLIFTLETVRRLGPSYVYYGTGGMPTLIASWRVISPHQVLLTMTRKVNPRWFVTTGIGNLFYPLPKHVFAGMDIVELRRRQNDPSLFSVSDGPFLLKEFVYGRHVVLVPNPLYGGHHPEIRRLVISFPTGNTALEQLRAGSLDMANVPYRLWDFARKLPGFRVVHIASRFTYGEGIFNMRSPGAPFLADATVRRAIVRAVDQKEIDALVFHGEAPADHGPVPSAMADFQSDKARAGYPDLSFDPDAARAALAADGWKPGTGGVLTRNGQRLAFAIQTSSESTDGVLMAQLIQRDLKKIGMYVSIEIIGFNQLLATLQGNGHDWQVATLSWSVETYPDVHDFFSSDGPQNYGHFVDATMDSMNRDVMFGTGDGPLHQVQDYTAMLAPYLYLPAGTPDVLVRPGIGGVDEFLGPNGMWSAELLTLSAPLACPVGSDDAPHA